jgi:Methyltransferase domain
MSFQEALDILSEFACPMMQLVHPHDFIFQFLINNPAFDSLENAIAYYFEDGIRSVEELKNYMRDICGWQQAPAKLLEFASGYGCLTRHFKNILPEVTVISCDIHEEAVQFISQKLGVPAVLSSSVPEALTLPDEYDFVFALSFFSHMPKATWNRWFNALLSKVKKGGFLLFTTQGVISRKYFSNPILDNEGFWFAPFSEQKDLDTSEYGMTIVTPSYVFQQAVHSPEARIIFYKEAAWWDHQDLYIVKRVPSESVTDVQITADIPAASDPTTSQSWDMD